MSTMRTFFFNGSVHVILLPPAKYFPTESRYSGYVGSIRIESKRATMVSRRVGFAVETVKFDLRKSQTWSLIGLDVSTCMATSPPYYTLLFRHGKGRKRMIQQQERQQVQDSGNAASPTSSTSREMNGEKKQQEPNTLDARRKRQETRSCMSSCRPEVFEGGRLHAGSLLGRGGSTTTESTVLR